MKQRFLGMTKDQFITAVIAVVALTFCLHAYTLYRESSLASEGAESHIALCVFKHDLAGRVRSSQAFLGLTVNQRVKKYGEGLGTIPPSVIRVGLHGQEASLASLHALHC